MCQLRIAVNVSASQFSQADFFEKTLAILEQTGANPALLKLELTESLLVASIDEVIAKMRALKARCTKATCSARRFRCMNLRSSQPGAVAWAPQHAHAQPPGKWAPCCG
jgi:hypothetical protein